MHAADVDFGLLPDVVVEVQDHLPLLESDLHRLVQAPHSVELLSSAFRRMHTIKGDFGYCNAIPIMQFVHHLEDVMQKLRDRTFLCSALVAEALLQSMDQVQEMMMVLVQTHQFDTKPRDALTRLIQQLSQANDQEQADELSRHILMAAHSAWQGDEGADTPEADPGSLARALSVGDQLADALERRMPAWQGRLASQRALVLALNQRYLQPCNPDLLSIAVSWHDVGLLALPDRLLLTPPKPKTDDWPVWAEHPQTAASWLLAVSPDCAEAAQIIRQHHLWANGAGIPAPDYSLPPHPGAQMLACADLLFEHVAGQTGDAYRRGVLRTVFDVNGGLDTRFDAALINAFEATARELTSP
ncbi:Hpt domain-containing protein [Parachitinimonas caeni]|uniref:Hpt domain-containing protein n=1 Tax=Parachitinimonas caeni TaxID=3031301 RepID=A0ABT7DV79_9NEIS|nr:Hpt domain-containing protein [Parachitinimonas caeni]MDK2123978.1 Hpt domain-containing protein [Parachitinimonas caeni]